MRGLEVSVNGAVLYTVGIGEFGMLSAGVEWARIAQNRGTIYEHLCVGARGQVAEPATARHWQNRALKFGDEVTVKVVEIDSPDQPLPGLPDFPGEVGASAK